MQLGVPQFNPLPREIEVFDHSATYICLFILLTMWKLGTVDAADATVVTQAATPRSWSEHPLGERRPVTVVSSAGTADG